MHVAVVSTFPPRRCGIATFAADLVASLEAAPVIDRVSVVAVAAKPGASYPPPVVAVVGQEVRGDYVRGAQAIDRLDVDVAIVQHEFGIFGGRDGEYVLSLVRSLSIPYVVTLHTVLATPEPHQEAVLRELCRGAAAVTVFTEASRRLLLEHELLDPDRIHVVPHGAPPEIVAVAENTDAAVARRRAARRWGTEGRFVLSSFGLLSPGKGIETTIDALASLVRDHPELLLVVAGRTHPEVARREGESYRLGLVRRVDDLGLADYVVFDDRFLDVGELADLLCATDLFVTAYRSREQIVSGALSFALASGRPVVSTPYRYAVEMLESGAGTLVPFDDAPALAAAIRGFVEHPVELVRAREAAREVGASLSWPEVGRTTADLLAEVAATASHPSAVRIQAALPPLRLRHLRTLVDDVGIVQHAKGAIPERATGYCVDDVARLAIVAHRLGRRTGSARWRRLELRSLAFLRHAADGAGGHGLRNLLGYDRRWLDEPHVGDHVGRTIWALGELLSGRPHRTVATGAEPLLAALTASLVDRELWLRTGAYTLLGLTQLPLTASRRALATRLVTQLVEAHDGCASRRWEWFEDTLTYDNARLSQALLAGGRWLGDLYAVEIGLRSLAWYGEECGLDTRELVLPGHEGRGRDDPHPGHGDEQPLDVAALVEAELEAYVTTGEQRHLARATTAFEWFTGRNRAGVAVYDGTTGGCRDGLGERRPNENQGAESTLAYLAARLALEEAGTPAAGRYDEWRESQSRSAATLAVATHTDVSAAP
ncbi:MAG: glycosyltransferase family 4 protein [Gaiellales bacterium]